MVDEQKITRLHGARWIGIPEDSAGNSRDNILVYFRNVFYLDQDGTMELAISANHRYKLWINGRRIASGPCKGDRWYHYYDVVDVSRYLIKGQNIIAAEVVYYPPSLNRDGNKKGPMGIVTNPYGPLLIVRGQCYGEDGRILADITTGVSDWKAQVDKAITWRNHNIGAFAVIGAFEQVDGSKIPSSWKTDVDSVNGWLDPVIKWEADGSGWGQFPPLPLFERDIPFMFERPQEFIREMKIRRDDLPAFSFHGDRITLNPWFKGVVELDAGELTTGYFILKTSGGLGSRINIRYAESYSTPVEGRPALKGMRDDSLNHIIHGFEDEYLPSGGEDVYETFWFRTFRFIRLEVEVGEFPLTLYKPWYIETGYPLEIKSDIESDCEWVRPLWETSIRTLQRCMHETYEDCPYYEQLQYTLDARLEILFTYMLSGDTRLAAKAIRDFHSSLTPEGLLSAAAPTDETSIIPVFSLYWILMLEDYYWQTGDKSILARYRPTMDAILDWFDRRIGKFGLIENLYYWEFIDWADEWRNEMGVLTGIPRASYQGPCTTSNLVYAAGLQSAAFIMDVTGRHGLAMEYNRRAEAILQAIEKYCWSMERHMYREGPNIEEYTQHAQAWAVITGLAEKDRAREILQNSLDRKDVVGCTFVYSFFLFRALEKSGLYQATERLWDKWKNALKYNLTTWPEDLTTQRSDCHGWSSLPLYEFTRCVLGVQPLEPGWEKIQIRPIGLYLPNAKGKVITPKGMIEVGWSQNNGQFFIAGQAPSGVPIEIVLPNGRIVQYPSGGAFKIYEYIQ